MNGVCHVGVSACVRMHAAFGFVVSGESCLGMLVAHSVTRWVKRVALEGQAAVARLSGSLSPSTFTEIATRLLCGACSAQIWAIRRRLAAAFSGTPGFDHRRPLARRRASMAMRAAGKGPRRQQHVPLHVFVVKPPRRSSKSERRCVEPSSRAGDAAVSGVQGAGQGARTGGAQSSPRATSRRRGSRTPPPRLEPPARPCQG